VKEAEGRSEFVGQEARAFVDEGEDKCTAPASQGKKGDPCAK
jgi:hypothetical protein